GRTENAQVAVYLAYAAPGGQALIDRELYLPRSWTADPGRCQAAGIPADRAFATKPALARRMLARALDAGVPAGWVAGDEVYGADPGLRADLEARRTGYVLAVACLHRVTAGLRTCRADELARRLPRSAWQRRSAGQGAKGPRHYDGAWISAHPAQPGPRWLLIRRNRRTAELAFYRCYSPRHVPLATLVPVAGRRGAIEMVFSQLAKGRMRAVGRGWQHVADLNFAAGDDHAVDEQLGEQPPLGKGGGGQPGAGGLEECFAPVGDGGEFQPLPGGGVQLVLLGQEGGAAAVQFLAFAFQLGQAEHLGQVGVQQPLQLAV